MGNKVISIGTFAPEGEKPWQQGSIATQKVFCRLERLKKNFIKIICYLKTHFRTKAFNQKYGIFLYSLEDFQTVWTIPKKSGKILNSLKDFRTV